MNYAILVVLYNKEMKDSETLNSLSKYSFPTGDIRVLNNGPYKINQDNDLFDKLKLKYNNIEVITHLDNRPLSKIYNEFIGDASYDYYVILDDDSELTSDFMSSIGNANVDIILPQILSKTDGSIYYPVKNGLVVNECKSLDLAGVVSITSGVIIKRDLIKKVRARFSNVFDERFALYGIDTSFFLRLQRLRDKGVMLSAKCESILYHSLSRTEGKMPKFRRIERLYDIAVTARHYPEYVTFYHLVKKIILSLANLDFQGAAILIKYYTIGKHPRC
ncbi:glycosyltransferase family 2 protein [Serratia liquefaciens]|uniref:glycosyltransferase family 2 protein n=1 Tax=Serratia liquefaciens TaxID=614 RepID=UPI00101F846E|nr:glycosyltransferase [Serratia liquefaciens]